MAALNHDGVDAFISYACSVSLFPKGRYRRFSRTLPGPGKTISFQDFIKIIDKFTERGRSKVKLDAKIIHSDDPEINYLKVWGIKDVGVRDGTGAKRFPGYQEGDWSCILEDALKKGIPPFRIREFRKNLGLRVEDKISNTQFFA